MATYVVGGILALVVIAVIRKMIHDKKSGNSGCGCGCDGCSGCSHTAHHQE